MTKDPVGESTARAGMGARRQVSALNRLITACKDDGLAYRAASRRASSVDRRAQMLGVSRRRSGFASELSRLVSELGGAPARYGSARGVAHRFARAVQIALAGPHEGDATRDCWRVDEQVRARYTRALLGMWPDDVRAILRAQSREIASDCVSGRAESRQY